MQALFTLTPAESKRLIGKAVAALPRFRTRRKRLPPRSRGSTNAYILEELLGSKIKKEVIRRPGHQGRPVRSGTGRADQAVTFHKGQVLPVEPGSVLDKLSPVISC